MSYILDALKKSEQELKNHQAPGLGTLHGSPGAPARPGRSIWLIFSLIVVLVNGLFIYWYTRPEPIVSVKPGNPETIISDELVSAERQQENLQVVPQDLTMKAISNPGSKMKPVRIAELPVSVQRQIPDLKISSHIYADDPVLRMVNINNRSLREGDFVSDDIKLVGITEDGVVLSYRHYTFELSVIRDWSFD